MNVYEQLKQIFLDQISDCRKKKQYISIMKNQALLNYYDGQIFAYENMISIISGDQPAADLYESAALEIEADQQINDTVLDFALGIQKAYGNDCPRGVCE